MEQLRPDLVTILIGVNDWVQGVNAKTFEANLRIILDRVMKAVPEIKNIVIVTIPDFPASRDIAKGIPVQRLGRADDVARAVMFFSSPANDFITGQTLYVCGGASIGSITI